MRAPPPGLPTLFNESFYIKCFPDGSEGKNLRAILETRVRSLGGEDLLEKGTATHCSTLAQRIPWTEAPGGLQSMGSQWVGHDWVTNTHTHFYITQAWPALKGWVLAKQGNICRHRQSYSCKGSTCQYHWAADLICCVCNKAKTHLSTYTKCNGL